MKTDRIDLRATPEQKSKLKEMAELSGKRMSNFIISTMLDGSHQWVKPILELRKEYVNEKNKSNDDKKVAEIQERIEMLDKIIIDLHHISNNEKLEI